MRRVVVTGMGIVSPLGNDLATSWDGIVNGRSGIGPVTHFDASNLTTRICGEVRDFDITRWVNAKDARKMDEFIHYGVAASLMALVSRNRFDELPFGINLPSLSYWVGNQAKRQKHS